MRCPYCLADLAPEEAAVSCTLCLTRHHAGCYREHGRCTIFGCEGEEVTSDRGARLEPGWELHPLLPPGADAQARFVSVSLEHDPAPRSRGSTSFRLELADRVTCGDLLEGTLTAFVPRALHGWGLRLSVQATPGAASTEGPFSAQAALLGHPDRSWLDRVRARLGDTPPVLLKGGRTRVSFRFDPSPFTRRARVDRHDHFGLFHRLGVQAHLASRTRSWKSREHSVLVQHLVNRCKHR